MFSDFYVRMRFPHNGFSCVLRSVEEEKQVKPRSRRPKWDRVLSSPKNIRHASHTLNESSMDSNHHEAAMAIDCKNSSIQTC